MQQFSIHCERVGIHPAVRDHGFFYLKRCEVEMVNAILSELQTLKCKSMLKRTNKPWWSSTLLQKSSLVSVCHLNLCLKELCIPTHNWSLGGMLIFLKKGLKKANKTLR